VTGTDFVEEFSFIPKMAILSFRYRTRVNYDLNMKRIPVVFQGFESWVRER
jgi:hypothetical protein